MTKRRRSAMGPSGEALASPVNSLDDGCLMHIFSFLSPIPVSTAIEYDSFSSFKEQGHGVTVVRTRIEGGAKAVRTNGTLALQRKMTKVAPTLH
ncbi:hypothetical protein E2562_015861 [Oryza meyeriana var. granulata]|uniref:Uncharacterized protein n=1 Tax=Oryza meyeriana var. granulata TaxID=110450 RepID=A0A6G1D4M3_9ORYZ|nr:hypothetical protein E2562_015861 [Oryza meyeriana var. granulata]